MSTPPPIMSPLVGDDETPEATLPAVAHTMLPTVEKKQRSRLSTLFSPVFNALGLVASGDEEKAVSEELHVLVRVRVGVYGQG
mgnify:CR=1 FL=1